MNIHDLRDELPNQKVTNHPAENFMGKCKLKKKIEKRGIYVLEKKESDSNFLSFNNTRNRNSKSLKGLSKTSSTIDILGIDIDTYRRRIENRMTSEMNWSIFDIDHVKPISSIEVSFDEGVREAFNWIKTQPS